MTSTLDDAARGLVERTCAAQSLPVQVTDPVTLARVAALLNPPCDEGRSVLERPYATTKPDATSSKVAHDST